MQTTEYSGADPRIFEMGSTAGKRSDKNLKIIRCESPGYRRFLVQIEVIFAHKIIFNILSFMDKLKIGLDPQPLGLAESMPGWGVYMIFL